MLFRSDVDGWRDVVAVAAGSVHTVGVCADGTVRAAGDDTHGQCGVRGWRDVTAVAAGASHTLGLRADGTAVAVGDDADGQCDVDAWRDLRRTLTRWANGSSSR